MCWVLLKFCSIDLLFNRNVMMVGLISKIVIVDIIM